MPDRGPERGEPLMNDYDDNPLCFVAESPVHGRGLFARCEISADTWIGHYDGPQTQTNGMHVLWVDESTDGKNEDHWVGYNGNNELRFMNHSAQPNGEMDGLDLYAVRTIKQGEEITIGYGEEFESGIE